MSGFWNYLREDITFSLFYQCPLKMDLSPVPPLADISSDASYLNAISLILGRIVNSAFADEVEEHRWMELLCSVKAWHQSLPKRFAPFSTASEFLNLPLPLIWMLRDSHGMFCSLNLDNDISNIGQLLPRTTILFR